MIASSLATLESCREVYNAEIPHYFRHLYTDQRSVMPRVENASGLDTDDPQCGIWRLASYSWRTFSLGLSGPTPLSLSEAVLSWDTLGVRVPPPAVGPEGERPAGGGGRMCSGKKLQSCQDLVSFLSAWAARHLDNKIGINCPCFS